MKIKKISIAINNIEDIIAIAALMLTVLLTAINVFTRPFGLGMPWSSEIAGFGWTWAVMFGISISFRKNLHYGMDFFVARLPKKIRYIFIIIVYFVVALTCLFMLYLSIIITINGGIKISSYFRIPYTYKYISSVIAFVFMSFHSVRYLIMAFKNPELFQDRIAQGGTGLDEEDNDLSASENTVKGVE